MSTRTCFLDLDEDIVWTNVWNGTRLKDNTVDCFQYKGWIVRHDEGEGEEGEVTGRD